jgi:hypothetical protein
VAQTMNLFPNPELYRKLSEPYGSLEEANKEMADFLEAVAELRKKHKIPSLQLIMMGSAKNDKGTESDFIAPAFYGDSMRMEMMLAYAMGQAASERQQMLGEFMKNTIKKYAAGG